jgi:hypothetical protein
MNRIEPLSDNAPRFPLSSKGHVESWFFRANDPQSPRAFWLKATVLRRDDGTAVAEAWCALFDGDQTFAEKITVPLADARFGDDIAIGACAFDLGGSAVGAVEVASWDVRWTADDRLGAPMIPYPSRRFVDGAFPKSKLLTPVPVAGFAGSIVWNGRTISVDGWTGMQGHNWGRAHALEYAWGQCVFPDGRGRPHCVAEGFSGRIKVAGVTTPTISSLVVRRDDREYRFDRLFDLWNQQATVRDMTWTARFAGADGEAMLSMEADPRQMVCLGYHNPDGRLSYCLNSKLASTILRVNPVNEPGFECRSRHGGALEFLRAAPDPRLPHVV